MQKVKEEKIYHETNSENNDSWDEYFNQKQNLREKP